MQEGWAFDTSNRLHYINTEPLDYQECFSIPLATILWWRTQRIRHWFWCPNLRNSTKKVWPEIRKMLWKNTILPHGSIFLIEYLYRPLYGLYLMSNHWKNFDINPKNKRNVSLVWSRKIILILWIRISCDWTFKHITMKC